MPRLLKGETSPPGRPDQRPVIVTMPSRPLSRPSPLWPSQEAQLRHWLGAAVEEAAACYHSAQATLRTLPDGPVLVTTAGRVAYLSQVIATVDAGRTAIFGNPQWEAEEWLRAAQVLPENTQLLTEANSTPLASHAIPAATLTSPGETAQFRQAFRPQGPAWPLGGDSEFNGLDPNHPPPGNAAPELWLPTGGSTGKFRLARHSVATLDAAAAGYQRHFRLAHLDTACPLPIHHIGGWMTVWRSLRTGGRLRLLDPRETPSTAAVRGTHLSCVGTQWQRWLGQAGGPEALAAADCVLIGGGPPPSDLAEQARRHGIRAVVTYGLTEAAATVALGQVSVDQLTASGDPDPEIHSRPEAPAAIGAQILPHWTAELSPGGEVLLSGPALALGWWPPAPIAQPYPTGDLARWDAQGRLVVLGRADRLIVSGGEKTDPAELEGLLLATGALRDVAVVGLPDAYWGQLPVCAAVPSNPEADPSTLVESLARPLRQRVAPWKLPRRWLLLHALPRTELGKLRWAALQELPWENAIPTPPRASGDEASNADPGVDSTAKIHHL